MSYRVQILHGSSYGQSKKIQKYNKLKIQKIHSPAPAINTQKEENMQKEQQNKKNVLSRQLLVLRTC